MQQSPDRLPAARCPSLTCPGVSELEPGRKLFEMFRNSPVLGIILGIGRAKSTLKDVRVRAEIGQEPNAQRHDPATANISGDQRATDVNRAPW